VVVCAIEILAFKAKMRQAHSMQVCDVKFTEFLQILPYNSQAAMGHAWFGKRSSSTLVAFRNFGTTPCKEAVFGTSRRSCLASD